MHWLAINSIAKEIDAIQIVVSVAKMANIDDLVSGNTDYGKHDYWKDYSYNNQNIIKLVILVWYWYSIELGALNILSHIHNHRNWR